MPASACEKVFRLQVLATHIRKGEPPSTRAPDPMRAPTAVLHRPQASLVTAVAIGLGILAVLAFAYVIYALWPRWPDAPPDADAPALPIVIGDVLFQIPPAAIRQKVQRRSGIQERIDLAYLWPSLEPSALTHANTMVPA